MKKISYGLQLLVVVITAPISALGFLVGWVSVAFITGFQIAFNYWDKQQ